MLQEARALERAERATSDEPGGSLGFGERFTDHLVTLRWTETRGWHDPRLAPYGPLSLDPAALALHYGQVIFEGLKAYRQRDGGVAVFRPLENARRFCQSAVRLGIPPVPEELFMHALRLLLAVDSDWVPDRLGQSLYLRPFILATEATLAVRPAHEYLFVLIASPVDPFFSAEARPLKVWISDRSVRAVPGGTGNVKYAGNYAPAFLAQADAAAEGCDQVVWLDSTERRWVEEMGAMNLFFVWRPRVGAPAHVTTPELTGTLLPGIVRDSMLTLAPELGYTVAEERLSVERWRTACSDGRMLEVFATGTAAVVAPIGEVRSMTGGWRVGDGHPGPVALRLRDALLAIQHGTAPDKFRWMERMG